MCGDTKGPAVVRHPEAKIKEAILHPDLDVRDMAIRYFYSSTSIDHTFMPLAIQAIERYGRTKAFSFTHYLNLLPQTEQTIGWVIAELQREGEGRPEEQHFYYLNLSRLLYSCRYSAGRPARTRYSPRSAFRPQGANGFP